MHSTGLARNDLILSNLAFPMPKIDKTPLIQT